jgi:tetratricopeptide (TPR) repeat protein
MRTRLLLALNVALIGGCAAKDPSAAARAKRQKTDAEWNSAEPQPEAAINADTRFAAGQLAESQGQADQAVAQYREALKLNPAHAASLYRLGVLFTQSRQYAEALDYWKQYVSASGGTAVAYNNLGFCLELAGKSEDAEQAYRDGIARDGASEQCRVNYGLLLARSGREAEAIEQLSAVLKPAEVHYNLASVYEQLGRTVQAKAEYERAIQLDPKLWEAQSRLSRIE